MPGGIHVDVVLARDRPVFGGETLRFRPDGDSVMMLQWIEKRGDSQFSQRPKCSLVPSYFHTQYEGSASSRVYHSNQKRDELKAKKKNEGKSAKYYTHVQKFLSPEGTLVHGEKKREEKEREA